MRFPVFLGFFEYFLKTPKKIDKDFLDGLGMLKEIEEIRAKERQIATQLNGKDENGIFKTSVVENFPQPNENGKSRPGISLKAAPAPIR